MAARHTQTLVLCLCDNVSSRASGALAVLAGETWGGIWRQCRHVRHAALQRDHRLSCSLTQGAGSRQQQQTIFNILNMPLLLTGSKTGTFYRQRALLSRHE